MPSFRRTLTAALALLTAVTVIAPAQAATQSTSSWALDRIDQAQRPISGTYTYTDSGQGVNIYVIDSGISFTSTDLTGRINAGASMFRDQQSSADCWGTGTAAASAAAGTAYGVAKNATVTPIRAYDCQGKTSLKTLATAVNYINRIHQPATREVILLNLGNLLGKDKNLDKAITKAHALGMPVIIPAGDRGKNPCSYSGYTNPATIVVGATDTNDVRAQFPLGSSNFGKCVDLYAPGVNVPAASLTPDGGNAPYSGTIMAAALTAGWVARYLSANPGISLSHAITWTNSDLIASSSKNVVVDSGVGFPNRLLNAPTGSMLHQIPPTAPAGVIAWPTGTNGEIAIAWATPSSAGSNPITGYRISMDNTTGLVGVNERIVGVTNQYTWTGLTTGVTRKFYVEALTSSSTGKRSPASNAVKLVAKAPSAPGTVSAAASISTPGSVTVSWTSSPNDGGSPITGYQVYLSTTTGEKTSVTTVNASTFSARIDNLTSAKTYYAYVKAVNAAGASTATKSSGTATPYTLPGLVGALTMDNPTVGSYRANWTAPTSNGGSAITGYALRYSPDGVTWSAWVSTTALKYTFTGWSNGRTYLVEVAAVTAVGRGPAAQSSITTNNAVA